MSTSKVRNALITAVICSKHRSFFLLVSSQSTWRLGSSRVSLKYI